MPKATRRHRLGGVPGAGPGGGLGGGPRGVPGDMYMHPPGGTNLTKSSPRPFTRAAIAASSRFWAVFAGFAFTVTTLSESSGPPGSQSGSGSESTGVGVIGGGGGGGGGTGAAITSEAERMWESL